MVERQPSKLNVAGSIPVARCFRSYFFGFPTMLQLLLISIGAYALMGIGVAVWFVEWGAARHDPVAGRALLRVRVLFAPGAVAVWPALLVERARDGGTMRTGAE